MLFRSEVWGGPVVNVNAPTPPGNVDIRFQYCPFGVGWNNRISPKTRLHGGAGAETTMPEEGPGSPERFTAGGESKHGPGGIINNDRT